MGRVFMNKTLVYFSVSDTISNKDDYIIIFT